MKPGSSKLLATAALVCMSLLSYGTGIVIPLAGNAYITQRAPGGIEAIEGNGLVGWANPGSIVSTYFRLEHSGQLTLSLKAKVPSGSSTIKVVINGVPFTVSDLAGDSDKIYPVGTVNIDKAGYIKVDLHGISKTGKYFAVVSELVIDGPATTGALLANDPKNFYWSRRGPSVHLGYKAPPNTEWFYNEVTVPVGEDIIGSYFMSNGFNVGYFGIQVNSSTERRVLFSVWDPKEGKTTLVRKGANVTVKNFGGEGTGGQSYLVYSWQAGTTYKFLTQGKPDGEGNTLYSSWFYTPESGKWNFIATWKRPETNSYLTGLYSFLENFNEERGWQARKAFYSNQWVRSSSGTWSEIVKATFTADATAHNQQRKDYRGGVENGSFFLKNCGFFSDFVRYDTAFSRAATGKQPVIDISSLP
jgi:hypothetical protein